MRAKKSGRERFWLSLPWALGILFGLILMYVGVLGVVQAYGNERWFEHLKFGPLFFAVGLNLAAFAGVLFTQNTIKGLAAPDPEHELLPEWWWVIMRALLFLVMLCFLTGTIGDLLAP